MQLVLPEQSRPLTLILDQERPLSDDEFFDLCMANADLRLERTSQGEIIIMPPAGGESDFQSGEVFGELREWAKRDGRGKCFGSSVAFILPTHATLAPDSAWVSNQRIASLSKQQRRKFLPIAPEFVVEVMSPSDRLKDAMAKMQEWMAGGVELAWLIDPDHQAVYIYRAGHTNPEERAGVNHLAGEGPIAGFELDLTEIWAGL